MTAGILLQRGLLNPKQGNILYSVVYDGKSPIRDIVFRATKLQGIRNEKTDRYRNEQKNDP